MKSKWMVSENYINGKRMYIAYRLLDRDAVDHSGNREYKGTYSERVECVEALVEQLNDGTIT